MDSLSPVQPPRSHLLLLSTILVIVLLGSLYYYLKVSQSPWLQKISLSSFKKIISNQDSKVIENEMPVGIEPTPTPIPLPTGLQSYEFTHGAQVVGPKVAKIVYDPLTPSAGETQKVTLTAAYSVPITEVVLTIVSDHLITPHVLSLASGTNTNGTWTGSWVIDDTLNTRYAARTTLKSTIDTHDSAMWFRNQ